MSVTAGKKEFYNIGKRFPTYESLVEAKLLLPHEVSRTINYKAFLLVIYAPDQ